MTSGLKGRRLHLRHSSADHDSVRDLSVEVRPGEILALVGPNGSGKSTLLRALGNDLPLRQGELSLTGSPLGPIREEPWPVAWRGYPKARRVQSD